MNIAMILKALELAGAATPAFQALFEQVKGVLGEDDRATLEVAYEKAMDEAAAQHERAQNL